MTYYNKTFYWLSAFFALYFFVFPLIVSYNQDVVFYVGKIYEITSDDFYKCIYGIIIFGLGFIFFDACRILIMKRFTKVPNVINEQLHVKKNKLSIIFYIFLFFFISYTIYQVVFINVAEIHYAVRRGEQSSDLIAFFISNVMNAIKLLLILSLLSINNRRAAFVFVLFVIITSLSQSTGRLSLLLNLCLLILIAVPMKPNKIAMLTIPGVVILMPVLFSLKEIIYSISTNGSVDFSIIDLLGIDSMAFINNFGHPLISFINVDNLVSSYGYAYFWDYIQGFLFYFKILGIDFGLSITYFNTYVLMGVKESIIPPGYLAFGFVQLGFLGVFIAGSTYRAIGYFGERFYLSIFKNHSESYAAIFYISFMCANSFYHGDFRVFVMTLFFPIIFSSITMRLTVIHAK